MDTTSPLDALVDLRQRSAVVEPPDPDTARAFLRGVYEGILRDARRAEFLKEGERFLGAVVMGKPPSERFGAPEDSVVVLCDPEAPQARDWAAVTLADVTSDSTDHCTVLLPATDQELMGPLETLGFGPSKLGLVGALSPALRAFEERAREPGSLGVRFEDAQLAQAPLLCGLMRDFFAAHPALGFGSSEPSPEEQAEIDEREVARMEERLTQGRQTDFVVTEEGAVRGYFGFTPYMSHPLFGPVAGLDIVLLPGIQGRGVGTAAYLHMLRSMDAMGISSIFGRTSNPAVIHLGVQTGRRLRRIVMRRDGPFIDPGLIPPS